MNTGEKLGQGAIVAPFALFEVEVEIPVRAVELCHAAFCKAPECLDDIDFGGFFRFADTRILVVPDVHQPVVAPPSFGLNDVIEGNFALDKGAKRLCPGSWDQFGVYGAVALIDAENGALEAPLDFCGGANTLFNAGKTHVFLVRELMGVNQAPKRQKVPVHGLSVQLQEQGGFGRVNVDAKAFNQFSNFVSTQFAILKHISRLSHPILMV